MSIVVYQSFELKQEKFKEGIVNAKKIKKYRNENYAHQVELLNPIVGLDYTFVFLATYEGLAEMELQNKVMFYDKNFSKLMEEFFLKHVVQGSMMTQIYRSMDDVTAQDEDNGE